MTSQHQGTVLHSGHVDASPPPQRPPRGPGRRGSAIGLQVTGVLVAWVLIYLGFLSSFQQSHAQHALYGELRTQLALGEAPTGAPIARGTPLGVVSVPRLGLRNMVIVEGTRNEQLQKGPGHVSGTVLPGQKGVSVVAGRSATFGAPFRDLANLERGASIKVTTVQGTFTYAVTGVRVAGDPYPAATADTARLTLVTSLRSQGFLGSLRPSRTVYVDAELPSSAAVDAGAVGSGDPGVSYMKGRLDVRTLALLALALQLLLVVVGVTAWSWRRWSRRATWIVAGPALLASAWLATSLASLLLPGLI